VALTLLRHAPLHPKDQKRYNGWTNLSIDPALFDIQAVQPLCRQHFDHIFTSDLLRCTQTLDLMQKTPYTPDARLREVRFKAHIEGLSYPDVSKRTDFCDTLLEDHIAWHHYICAESYDAFGRRVGSFLAELPQNCEILVCTHGGVIQRMMSLLHLPTQQVGYLEYIRIEDYELPTMV